MLILHSSFLSNEQVYFFFFQMNEILVILKFKKHQHIGKSVVVFLKCFKEPEYADFWLHLQFNKACFVTLEQRRSTRNDTFSWFWPRILKIKKKIKKSLQRAHNTKSFRIWCNPLIVPVKNSACTKYICVSREMNLHESFDVFVKMTD